MPLHYSNYLNLPGNDVYARPERPKRLQKMLSRSEERRHFWSRRRNLSVEGRKPVRLSHGGKGKDKISTLERDQLRTNMERAIKRVRNERDALWAIVEAGLRGERIKLPQDMSRHIQDWFKIREDQITLDHIGQMHDKMSQFFGLLTHPKFEIEIKENSEGNSVVRRLLTKKSQKISIQLTRRNAFDPKNGMRALITAVGINGADLFDDREALRYGIPGTYEHAKFKASSYAGFFESRQTEYERNWHAARQHDQRMQRELLIRQEIEQLYVDAPRLDSALYGARADKIAQSMWDIHSGGREIRQITPNTRAQIDQKIRAFQVGIASRSQTDYEREVRDWLNAASGMVPSRAGTHSDRSRSTSPTRVGQSAQDPPETPPPPSPTQGLAESLKLENDRTALRKLDLLRESAATVPRVEFQKHFDSLKQEIGDALCDGHLSQNVYLSVHKGLDGLETRSTAAPTRLFSITRDTVSPLQTSASISGLLPLTGPPLEAPILPATVTGSGRPIAGQGSEATRVQSRSRERRSSVVD